MNTRKTVFCLLTLLLTANQLSAQAGGVNHPPQLAKVTVLEVLADLAPNPPPSLPKELKPYRKPLKQAFGPKSKEHYNRFEVRRPVRDPVYVRFGEKGHINLIEHCRLELVPRMTGKQRTSLKTVLYKVTPAVGSKPETKKKIFEVDRPNRHRLIRTPYCDMDGKDQKRVFFLVSYSAVPFSPAHITGEEKEKKGKKVNPVQPQ